MDDRLATRIIALVEEMRGIREDVREDLKRRLEEGGKIPRSITTNSDSAAVLNCERHGPHAGICWPCADEAGRQPWRIIVAAHRLRDLARAMPAAREAMQCAPIRSEERGRLAAEYVATEDRWREALEELYAAVDEAEAPR